MSIGILTSGGDAPGMNAAIRAAFRSLKMRAPDCELMLFRDGFVVGVVSAIAGPASSVPTVSAMRMLRMMGYSTVGAVVPATVECRVEICAESREIESSGIQAPGHGQSMFVISWRP